MLDNSKRLYREIYLNNANKIPQKQQSKSLSLLMVIKQLYYRDQRLNENSSTTKNANIASWS